MPIRPPTWSLQRPPPRRASALDQGRRLLSFKGGLFHAAPRRRRCVQSSYALTIECLEDRTLFSVSPLPVPLVFGGSNLAHVSHFLSAPNEVDLYSVTLDLAEKLTATVNTQRVGSSLASVLRVFDAAGTPLALDDLEGGDPQLTFQAATAGLYLIGVSSAPNDDYVLAGSSPSTAGATTGQYALNVQRTESPVLLPDLTGSSLRLGTDMAAVGETVPVSFTVDNRGGGAPGNFQVQVVLEDTTPFDGSAQVLATLPRSALEPDASGRSFAAPAGFGVTLPAGLTTGPADLGLRIVADPAAPEFELGANTGDHRGTDFEPVTIVTLASAGSTNLSQVDAGLNTAAAGNLPSANQSDAYPFTVTQTQGPGQFTAEVAGAGGLLPRLTLLDGQGNLLIQSDSGQIVQHLLPGSYALAVSAQTGAGTFRLNTAFVASSVPNADLAGGPNTFSVAMADLNGDGIPDLVEVNRGANDVSVFLGVGDGTFKTPVSYAVGYFPWSVAIAALTPDGIPDLIVVNKGDGTVSVLLGNGDGTFQPQTAYPVGSRPGGVTVGDFGGDGVPDLAVSNYGDGTVSVLLGKGNGTFQPQVPYPVDSGPGPVQTADVNGDGIPDLITPNYLSGTVSVLLGQRDGSFQSAESIPITGGSPYALAIGDLNGDGTPDLVVANLTNNTLSVLLGDGHGNFALPGQTFATGAEPYTVTLADVNGDGHLDVVTADYSANSVSVLLGNGDGTLEPKTDFPVGKSPRVALVGDINGDGKPDIVTANNSGDSVTVLLGNGDGAFQTRSAVPAGPRPSSVAIADLTNDGRSDLVVANRNDGNVSVLLQNADGSFQTRETFAAGPSPNSVAVADVNGDGIPDLVVANYAYKGSVSVLLGNGDGTFQPPLALAAGHSVYAVAVGDLRGNGIDDIVAVNKGDGTVSVFLGNGDGTFQPQQVFSVGNAANAVTIGDVNGDGIADIVVANFAGDTVSVLLGNGDGTFQTQSLYAVGSRPSSVAIGDVNGDGIPDLIVADYGDNTVCVLLGQRGSGFAQAQMFAAGDAPNSIAVGDFTSDGNLDLVTANVVGNDATVLLGNGDGTFQSAVHLPAGIGAVALTVGRLNSDGHLDIALANETDGTISVIDGNGDGSFRSQQVITAGKNRYAVAVADINGDGSPDLITTSESNDTVSVSLGNGDGTFGTPLAPPSVVGSAPAAVAGADLNGDGRLDLVTANSDDNTVSVLLGNGNGTFQPADPQETFAVGRSPRSVVAADLTGDGIEDIVTTNYNGGTVSVLLGHGDGTFETQEVMAVGTRPYGLTVSDVNGDGIPDLIVANAGADTVSVLLGRGDGSFQPQETFAVGRQPFTVTVADLTGNGVPDLIAANAADNSVSVLMGLGGGRFAPQQVFAAGNQPFSVVAGDLTGTGHVDVITADNGGNSVGVLLGNGQGGFAPLQLVAANSLPTMLALADVNGDGRPDLVTVGNYDNATGILLNTGGGSFTPATAATDVALQNTPLYADLDHDGIPDEVVLDRSGNVLFRKGLANGAFAPPQILNPGRPARDITLLATGSSLAIAAADAHFDPGLSAIQSVFSVSLYSLNAADAGQRRTAYATPALPARIASADLTGDGLGDLVTANALDNSVSISLQTAPGVFAAPVTIGVGIAPSSIAFADVNHDGFLSVVVTDQASGDITVIINDASHAFTQTLRFRAGTGLYGLDTSSGHTPTISSLARSGQVVAGPFTGSGQTDLVVVNQGSHDLTLLAGDGNGGFANPTQALTATTSDPSSTNDQPGAIVAGDFNRDGKLDLAVLMTVNVLSPQTNTWTPTGQVWIYSGNGDGAFEHTFTIAVGDEATGLSVIPGNGTGLLDLLVGNGFGDVLRLQGKGDGTFQITGKSVSLSVLPNLFGAGLPGVLVGNQQQNHVTVQAPSTGGSAFTPVATLGASAQLAPGAVQWAVLDRNAVLPDAVVLSTGSNAVIVYRTIAIAGGAPVFAPDPQTYFVGTAPTGITIADINGDGIPDMLITNQGSNDISVLFGADDASGAWVGALGPRLHSGGAGPIAVTVHDLAGNANADLIITNGGSGTETVLPGVGGGFFNDQQPQTLFQFGASIIQAPTFVGNSGVGYAVTDAGNLLRFDFENPAVGASLVFGEGDVVAAQAQANGDVVVALADGNVKVLEPAGDRLVVAAQLQAQAGTALSPSSLVVLQKTGGQLEVLVSSQGSDTIFAYSSGAGARAEPPGENLPANNASLSVSEFPFFTSLTIGYTLSSAGSESGASAGVGASVAAVASAPPSVATFTSYDNLAVVTDTSTVLVPVQGNAYSTVPVLGLGTLNSAERSDGADRNPALAVARPFGDTSPLTRFLIGQDDALSQHRDATGTRLAEPGRGPASDPWRGDLFYPVRPWQPPAVAPRDEDDRDDDGLAAPDFWGDDILERPRHSARDGPDLGVAALLIAVGLLGAAPLIAGNACRSSSDK